MTSRSRWSQGGFAQNAVLAVSLVIEADHKSNRGPIPSRLWSLGL